MGFFAYIRGALGILTTSHIAKQRKPNRDCELTNWETPPLRN